MIRPLRVVAIAHRDLLRELKGRRGWVLPAVMVGLMLPISWAPQQGIGRVASQFIPTKIAAVGEVPSSILALDGVTEEDAPQALHFANANNVVEVTTTRVPTVIRNTLDATDPRPVGLSIHQTPPSMPSRSMFLALLSASTLTGAVSASIGGERSGRTFIALLAASVTRLEVVLGKWLAWGGLGASSALMAAFVTIVLGRLSMGWWLLPMVTVPLSFVALGLWLVRQASDVMGGTTVTLRVLPAIVGVTGTIAWIVGQDIPLVGAAIPMGGALIAAGSTWGNGAAPALVATASTLALTAWLLHATSTDLEENLETSGTSARWAFALRTTIVAAMAWWPALLIPLLWGIAGNAHLSETLPRPPGVLAGAAGLFAVTALWLLRQRTDRPRWFSQPTVTGVVVSLVVGALLAAGSQWSMASTVLHFGEEARLRMAAALWPSWTGPFIGLTAILADELLFRGWLQERVGPAWAVAAWTAVKSPFDPLGGILQGIALTGIVQQTGSIWTAAIARSAAVVTAVYLPNVPPPLALGALLFAAVAMTLWARGATPSAS